MDDDDDVTTIGSIENVIKNNFGRASSIYSDMYGDIKSKLYCMYSKGKMFVTKASLHEFFGMSGDKYDIDGVSILDVALYSGAIKEQDSVLGILGLYKIEPML